MAISTIENTSRIVEKVIPYARKLFRKYGYKKTTVDEISSGTHISKKTLYSVFPSKDAILRETVLLTTLFRPVLSQIQYFFHCVAIFLPTE